MRQQNILKFQIGLSHLTNALTLNELALAMAKSATFISGGCTTSIKSGWWTEHGEVPNEVFSIDDMVREYCIEIEITTEPAKTERAYRHMQEAMALYAQAQKLDFNWVHCTQTIAIGRHFSVSELIADMVGDNE